VSASNYGRCFEAAKCVELPLELMFVYWSRRAIVHDVTSLGG